LRGAERILESLAGGVNRESAPFRLALVACVFALGMAGSGGWFYYNSHVLNRFRTSKQTREIPGRL